MTKVHFRSYIHNKMILFPQRIDKDIAEDDPVRLLDALVDNLMSDNVYKLYKPGGRKPYIPAALLGEISEELNKSLESVPEPETKEEKQAVRTKKKQLKELEKKRNKLQEYDQHLEIMGERNSYSKTDPDATFMHMKEDAMQNGQTKPGYNLQIATENRFITDFALYVNRTDTLTLPSFPESFKSRYHRYAKTVVADSGYGSEENYLFMDVHNMEAYVKYNCFHKE